MYIRKKADSIGCCFEVYNGKGNGYLEDVYQECLAIEFMIRGVLYVEKPHLKLEYKGHTLRKHYEPDFVCYKKIVLEIKAVKSFADESSNKPL